MKLFVPIFTNHSKRNDFCKLGYGVMVVTLECIILGYSVMAAHNTLTVRE